MTTETAHQPQASDQPEAEAIRAKMRAPLKKPATRPSTEIIIQIYLRMRQPARIPRRSPTTRTMHMPRTVSIQPKARPSVVVRPMTKIATREAVR